MRGPSLNPTREPPPYRWLALLLLTLTLILNLASMQRLTLTYDEPDHLKYGQHILKLDSARFDDSKMPVSALNALPVELLARLPPGPLRTTLARPKNGRYVTVLFSLLLAACVLRWARELYGPTAGLLALTLYSFDPNLLAHSQLITTDIFAAGMITFSLYTFWRVLELGGWRRVALSALVLGLAQLAKYTAVFLFPLFAVIALGRCGQDLWSLVRERRFNDLARRLRRFSGLTLVFLLVSLVVINAGFLFKGTFTSLTEYRFRSDLYRSVQSRLAWVGALPVPVPYPYLEGLDWVVHRERTGEGYGNLYLLGETRAGGRGFTGYYFYACLFKLPLATQLLLLMAAGAYLVRFRRFQFWRNEWVLIGPILAFTVYFNFFFRAQIGIRFFLVAFPLLFVFCGSLVEDLSQLPRAAKAAIVGLLAFLALSVLSYYPHFLSYFNELVWDRKQAYRVLADSNIDWGQNRWYLGQYRRAHPEVIVEPEGPTDGTIVVNVNSLTGVVDPERLRWLRENFRPVGHIAYSYVIFRVSPADLHRIMPSVPR